MTFEARAFREAMLALPREEYDWFDIQARSPQTGGAGLPERGDETSSADDEGGNGTGVREPNGRESAQRQFFDYAGPLHSVVISPASSTLAVNDKRRLRALPRDRSRRRVERDLIFTWRITEGSGTLSSTSDQEVDFQAPSSPDLVRLSVTVSQGEVQCSAETLITVSDSLDSSISAAVVNTRGLPGYTFERAPGELWRSRFDPERNLIVVNNGHRDFVFATRNRALQLRYLVRLYVKELVLKNFTGLPAEQLTERMIELSLYVEDKLKATSVR